MTLSVEQARKLAKKKHAHQTRKDGKTPYFNHLKKVVKNRRLSQTTVICLFSSRTSQRLQTNRL